ncbi:MAG: hypothetical protein AAFX76_08290 [Planctomycetota bacterium]
MTHRPSPLFRRLAVGLLCAAWVGSAAAIQPSRWVHSTEADFAEGELDGVVVTNLGDLKLAAATDALAELPETVTVIYDIEMIGDTAYLAAGPEGRVFAFADGELTEIAAFENAQCFALLTFEYDGAPRLVAAVSGSPSRMVGIDPTGEDEPEVFAEFPEGTRYVWDLVALRSPTDHEVTALAAATGPEGKVFRVAGQQVEELFDTSQANVLSLAYDHDRQAVYAGTDTDGLIYRFDESGTYVVYDAAEPEIGALLVTDNGTLYAGTADAEQARPGRLEDAAEEETGRPDTPAPGSDPGSPGGEDGVVVPPVELPIDPDPAPLDQSPAEAEGIDAQGPPAPDPDSPSPPGTADAAPNADTADEESAAPSGPPTPEQYDALREAVRARLLAARESGTLTASTGNNRPADRPTRNARPASTSGGVANNSGGNAVYRIDSRGFVEEVFRDSVMVLRLTERADGRLLIATGNEGQVYAVDPAADETAVLRDLESQQVLAFASADDGTILVGGANPAAFVALTDATAPTGTYTSATLDATQVSLWGKLRVTAELSGGDRVTVETRSGNVADPEIAAWSPWAEAGEIAYDPAAPPLQPTEHTVDSPPARFLQYRLTLDTTDDPEATSGGGGPVIEKLELAYVVPNLRPRLSRFTAEYPDFPGLDNPASPQMSLNWEATDPNNDRLRYTVEYQPVATSGALRPAGVWLTLAENLDDTSFIWDTRKVADGRVRLRVTATDRLDNPGPMALTAARRADPVLIDNTPPTPGSIEARVNGSTVKISGGAEDAWSPIHSIAYALNDAESYVPVLPDDLIYDSTREAWSAILSDLSPGGHAVTVRVTDTRGNASYTTTLFEVPRPN